MVMLCANGFESTFVRNQLNQLMNRRSGKVLIIPFACIDGEVEETGKLNISRMGFCKNDIVICTDKNIEQIRNEKYDFIIIPGGNFAGLITKINENKLLEYIKKQREEGTTLITIANALYLVCSNLEYVKELYHIENTNNTLCITEKKIICGLDYKKLNINDNSFEVLNNGEIMII